MEEESGINSPDQFFLRCCKTKSFTDLEFVYPSNEWIMRNHHGISQMKEELH